MYLDFLVKIPFVQGKITRRKKKDVVYIEFEYDRIYDPVRQYTFPKRVTMQILPERYAYSEIVGTSILI